MSTLAEATASMPACALPLTLPVSCDALHVADASSDT
jgi:hypothetical protein